MNLAFAVVIGAVLPLAVPTLVQAQGKADLSGKWTFNQAMSGARVSGNNPLVSFPTELLIKQSPAELNVETSTLRQDAIHFVYKLDGSEITVNGTDGMTTKAKAAWDGEKVVITSKRTFSSPAGEITADFKEVYSINGDVLTVEKTQIVGGVSNTGKAVYTKTAF